MPSSDPTPPGTPGTAHGASADPNATSALAAKIVPLRHPGRWAAAVVLIAIFAAIGKSVATNERFELNVVGHYLFSEVVLRGLWLTIQLTVIATLISLVLGTILALMRMSANPVLRVSAALYIWFFRSVPLLVQLIFLYNISALYPQLTIAVPLGGPVLFTGDVNAMVTPLLAAILGLGLNESAYTAETMRGALLSVGEQQRLTGKAMGFSPWQTTRLIVLPQAMRVFVPPFGNQVVNLLKMTTLVSVIALADLLYSAQLIYSRNFETIPLLIVASLWYLVIVSALSYGQKLLERRFAEDKTHRHKSLLARKHSARAAGFTDGQER
jgi:polar amino acid transport system permease protein